jgi:short-chain fatty acids transporter
MNITKSIETIFKWAIQEPIVVESPLKLGVPLPKAIITMAYGDQVTNML